MKHEAIQKLNHFSNHFVDLNKMVSLYSRNRISYMNDDKEVQSDFIENNLFQAHFLKTPNSRSTPLLIPRRTSRAESLIPDPSPQHQGEGRLMLNTCGSKSFFLLLMLGEGGELARRMRVERMNSHTKTRTGKPYGYNFVNARVKNGSFNQLKTLNEKASS